MKQQAIASVTVAKMALTIQTLSNFTNALASLTSSLPMAHPALAPLAPRAITKTVECGMMQHAKSVHTPRLTRMLALRGVVGRLVLSIAFLIS